MKRKVLLSGTVLMLLLTSMFASAFNIQPVKSEWTGTVYIRADGRIDPPDAPIVTYDNVTYTLTGNIRSTADGIVVERNGIVIDGAGHTIEGVSGGFGIFVYGSINVTIRNVNVIRFACGIELFSGSINNNIIGNTI